MKKLLLFTSLIFSTLISFSQDNLVVVKNFEKNINSLDQSFVLNEHMNVMMIAKDLKNFELIAVDDQMHRVWEASFPGLSITAGMFKGHVLAIAYTGGGNTRETHNICSAFLIDEHTGKLIQQKVIYDHPSDTWDETNTYFAVDGSWFKMSVRLTGLNKKSGAFSKMGSFYDTKDFTVIDLDQQLGATLYHPDLSNGSFPVIAPNYDGGFFFFDLTDKNTTLKCSRFTQGQQQPVAMVTQPISFSDRKEGSINGMPHAICLAKDPNLAFYSMVHFNQSKDMVFSLARMDFGSKTGKIINEVIDKPYVKAMESSFTPADKKVDNPYFSYKYNLYDLDGIKEYNGELLVSLSARYYYMDHDVRSSIFFKAFDKDLNLKFLQVWPGKTNAYEIDYHLKGNDLYVVDNHHDNYNFDTLYGELDLSSGKWKKLETIPRRKISNADKAMHNLWYGEHFVVAYQTFTHSGGSNADISLQQNTY